MLSIKDLSIEIGDFTLKNINIDVRESEYFVILGPSGSGKTVFLESLSGLYPLKSGEIRYKDKYLHTLLPENRNIGFVYQNYELFPHLSVRDNILFGLKIRKEKNDIMEEKLRYLTGIFNIENILNRNPRYLSGGEKQRVALARAIIISPDILILDEPFNALDVEIKPKLLREMKNIHRKFNTTIIHVTHDMNEAIYLADKIGVMKNGSLEVVEDKETFLSQKEEYIFQSYGGSNII